MKYINGTINIVVGIFLISVGCTMLSHYFWGTEEKIKNLRTLLNQGHTAVGIVDSVYTETTIKGLSLHSTKYFFEVDGRRYVKEMSFASPEELEPLVMVHYLPEDPYTSEINLEEKLTESEKNINSQFNLWGGLLVIGFAGFLIYFRGMLVFIIAIKKAHSIRKKSLQKRKEIDKKAQEHWDTIKGSYEYKTTINAIKGTQKKAFQTTNHDDFIPKDNPL